MWIFVDAISHDQRSGSAYAKLTMYQDFFAVVDTIVYQFTDAQPIFVNLAVVLPRQVNVFRI